MRTPSEFPYVLNLRAEFLCPRCSETLRGFCSKNQHAFFEWRCQWTHSKCGNFIPEMNFWRALGGLALLAVVGLAIEFAVFLKADHDEQVRLR